MSTEQNPIQTIRTELPAQLPLEHNAVEAIRRASSTPLTYSDAAIARVAWSVIIEPGDPEAGALIHTHGPVAALALVVNQSTGDAPGRLANLAGAQYNPSRVARRLELTDKHGFAILTPEDAGWPTRVAALGDAAPLLFWCRGNLEALNSEHSTAISGSRAATTYGEHVAMNLTSDLVANGHVIITGAAYGIDGMATRATLASGGTPAVVLAGGVDRFYPAGHHDLITRVATNGGVVISELPPTTAPTKWRFLARNRIIAALADQVVIVEAGSQSGSLNTAGHAKSIGRPVYAVPGPVTSPTSAGCHRLIREGRARLVTCAAEMS
ncbi:DNA-processing protein DprA [Herbiconiux daphne]|uniref:DNA-processing protein DprA n=1 Tax=Herbiconiux daphne TaxID=2970914 RepID=A0ABT2H6X4_9MICO|nr:DNA-processing protein DprA [Herbiconiux daphne]MCS5735669.1 DNA-processing protein DprA [Herbiconiux daphne]